MAGQDSSPIEPTKTHARLLGRGGVGNYQEAKKWETIPAQEPPLTKIEPVVRPLSSIHRLLSLSSPLSIVLSVVLSVFAVESCLLSD
jgi:hypothetical protein